MKAIPAIVLLIVLVAGGCGYTEKASTGFIKELNEPGDTIAANKLVNRVYHHVNEEDYPYPVDYVNGKPTRYIDSPYLEQPIFFLKNGILLFEAKTAYLEPADMVLGNDNEKFDKLTYSQSGWGVYNIKNDTITAIVYINFFGGTFVRNMLQKFQCHFMGILKDRDTILQWHLIPPYPKVSTRPAENIGYVESLKKPLDLYFKDVPVEKYLNPDKAWINKYKTGQPKD